MGDKMIDVESLNDVVLNVLQFEEPPKMIFAMIRTTPGEGSLTEGFVRLKVLPKDIQDSIRKFLIPSI